MLIVPTNCIKNISSLITKLFNYSTFDWMNIQFLWEYITVDLEYSDRLSKIILVVASFLYSNYNGHVEFDTFPTMISL